MNTHFKLIVSTIGAVLSIVAAVYCTNLVNDLANGFTQNRKAEVTFFAKLVRENWDGIKTVPDEKKKILLKNLNPDLAGTDIYVLRSLLLVFVYALDGLAAFFFVAISVSVWKKLRSGSSAP